MILKGNQLFFVLLTCLLSFELVACCVIVLLTRPTFETGINRLVLYLDFRVASQSSQNDRISYFWGDGEAGVYVQNLLTSVLLRTEI